MATAASVVCDLPQHKAPKSHPRKAASANIFQGIGLLQLRRLFHNSGDAQADERAQLVWECMGSHCIAQALKQFHRRQRNPRLRSQLSSGARLLELQHFNQLRIEDCSTSCPNDEDCSNSGKEVDVGNRANRYTASYYRGKKRGMGTAGYLHQLHRAAE
uniref:Arginine vasopressin-induced protein 1 n=1 Tax=Salvator merianae TaxID=96440 RepID=A0A8D0KNL6_SALMN